MCTKERWTEATESLALRTTDQIKKTFLKIMHCLLSSFYIDTEKLSGIKLSRKSWGEIQYRAIFTHHKQTKCVHGFAPCLKERHGGSVSEGLKHK